MGGRGATAGSGMMHISRVADMHLSLQPAQVAFTNVYQDKRYRDGRAQLRGSGGRLISRQALERAFEAVGNGRSSSPLEDLIQARQAIVSVGGYAESFKIVDNIPDDLVLPPSDKPFIDMDKVGETAVSLDFNYTIITPHDETAGAMRHYLKAFKEWRILARPAHEQVSRYTSLSHTYGMAEPTLTWVSSGQIRELYIPGVDSDKFRQKTALGLLLEKGSPTAAKRISRIMRAYLLIQAFPPEEVVIEYLDLDEKGAKVFDGSGIVSRHMLQKMMLSPDLSPEKREQLLWEIQHTKRVEYTILTPRGQDKGHAIVSDDLLNDSGNPVDFLLPQDTKLDTQDWSGQTTVGFNFVHHQDKMRLDDQSLINHRHFFPPDFLTERVVDRGKAFVAQIEQGGEGNRQPLSPRQTVDVMKRPLSEFIASGGDVRWSRHLLRTHMNQHINAILHTDSRGNERLRLPVEGARYYIKPDAVGKRAGIKGLNVPRGHIKIDPEYATAWVNADDWVELMDSPAGRRQGIADVLGGADNDDAVWLYPFSDVDADGEKRVLAWRSPNAPGEYVTLKPTADSHTIQWQRADGELIHYPERHSSSLTPRIDQRSQQTSSQIDPSTGGGMGDGQLYSLEMMEQAVDRATHNAGTLGRFVNTLMVYEAIDRPVELPAPLEDVIDAMNKTGEDLTPINAWIDARADELRCEGLEVPAYLHHRIGLGTGSDEGSLKPLKQTDDHWLDALTQQVKDHIRWLETQRDEMAEATTLPDAVVDFAFAHPHALELGAAYLRHYNAAYTLIQRERPLGLRGEDYDRLRQTAESFLNQFPQEHHESILLGAATSLHIRGEGGTDAALWLSGAQTDKSYKPGIGNKMVSALRRVGVLHDIGSTPEEQPGNGRSSYQVIGIQEAWRSWHQTQHRGDGSGISRRQQKEAKSRIQELAGSTFPQMSITVRQEENGFAVYTLQGVRLGRLDNRKGAVFSEDRQFKIQHVLADNGNLHVAVVPQRHKNKEALVYETRKS